MAGPRKDIFDLFAPDKGQQAGFTIDPGYGNLQMPAIYAAVLGPYRVAHGTMKTWQLDPDEPQKAASLSTASGHHCSYIALFLPSTSVGPAPLLVSGQSMLGEGSGVAVQLFPRIGPTAGASFSCVMLPGESLYILSAIPLEVIMSETYF